MTGGPEGLWDDPGVGGFEERVRHLAGAVFNRSVMGGTEERSEIDSDSPGRGSLSRARGCSC